MAEIDNKLQSPDYTSPEQSGDFRLKEISIHSPSNDQAQLLDTPSVFVELDIYEDLFSNVIKGTYTFLDTQGFAETIPIVGDETLIISFLTPGGEGTKPVTSTLNFQQEELQSRTASEEVVKQRSKENDVYYSHISTGHDFFDYEPDEWDIIVSNPPFTNKRKYFERALAFNKPIALIMTNTWLNDSAPKQLFKDKDLQLLMFDKRMKFNSPDGRSNDKITFSSSYYCWNFLPKQIIMEELCISESKAKLII